MKPSYPVPSSPAVSAVMRGNRRSDTGPELALRKALHARGFRFRVQMEIRAGDVRVRPDIVFSRNRLAVFVDGCFWHGCPEHGTSPHRNVSYWSRKLIGNRVRDNRVDAALAVNGWTPVRIWEHVDPDVAAAEVADLLNSRR